MGELERGLARVGPGEYLLACRIAVGALPGGADQPSIGAGRITIHQRRLRPLLLLLRGALRRHERSNTPQCNISARESGRTADAFVKCNRADLAAGTAP